MQNRITFWVIRCMFLLVALGIGVFMAAKLHRVAGGDTEFINEYTLPYMLVALGIAIVVVTVDFLSAKTDVRTVSAVAFGLLIGLIMAYLFTNIIALVLPEMASKEAEEVQTYIQLALTAIFCFLGVTFILRTKDDFKFIIPYVEFKKDLKGPRIQILDTSALIGGRMAAFLSTGVLDADVAIPGFVLGELHALADSEDNEKRRRGRRGLEAAGELKSELGVRILERDAPGDTVDQKLLELARALEARIITMDFNLVQRAKAEEIAVLNLYELSQALRPMLGIGERLPVKIVRQGEEKNQGVGYLEDGTMVVIEGAADKVGSEINAVITNTHRSPAGLIIFARVELAKSSS